MGTKPFSALISKRFLIKGHGEPRTAMEDRWANDKKEKENCSAALSIRLKGQHKKNISSENTNNVQINI